jgi:Arc/MetJ-type ribon-helix-helix transcriptional regulator
MLDITELLTDWPYDPHSCVRKIEAEDGRELLQVRTPLGIEQYELAGRPDGLQPYGCETVLEHIDHLIEQHLQRPDAGDFELSEEMTGELQQENLIYYYRYLICFQIAEYEVVVRDTGRNLRAFDLIQAYCRDEEAVNSSEQYRPYVLRMNAAARALICVGRGEYDRAKDLIRAALRAVTDMREVPTATFQYEQQRSLAILRGMLKAIPEAKPPSEEDLLRKEMHDAIATEDYERAAEIRDLLRQAAG